MAHQRKEYIEIPDGTFPSPNDTTVPTYECPPVSPPSSSCSCPGNSVYYQDPNNLLGGNGGVQAVNFEVINVETCP